MKLEQLACTKEICPEWNLVFKPMHRRAVAIPASDGWVILSGLPLGMTLFVYFLFVLELFSGTQLEGDFLTPQLQKPHFSGQSDQESS